MFYPKAKKKLIPAGASDPEIIPVGVVLHVAASRAKTLFGWFNGPSGGVESHLYLRRYGKWEQYRSLTREADAQYKGNSWIGPDGRRYGFISVETAGLGKGRWNKRQLAELQDFLAWASKRFDFPLRVVKTAQPDSPAKGGIGYHTQFEAWSNVSGKTCPGPRRKVQFARVLVPWMRDERVECARCPKKGHCPKKETK